MPVSFGETTITRATCASRIRAIAHALPVTSNATQSRGVQALGEQLQRLGPRLDPARRPQPALRDDRHLTEVAMDIQRYRSHSLLLAVDRLGENRWANDIDGSALAAQPGKSQGRPLKSPGSKPIAQNGLPNLRSPEGPCPSRPNLSRPPDDTGAFTEQFHAARSSRARQPAIAAMGFAQHVSTARLTA